MNKCEAKTSHNYSKYNCEFKAKFALFGLNLCGIHNNEIKNYYKKEGTKITKRIVTAYAEFWWEYGKRSE